MIKKESKRCIVNYAVKISSALILIYSLNGFAQANEAWVVGPSIVTLGTTATYNGGNLEPSTLVRIQIQENGTSAYEEHILVSDEGTFSHEIAPNLDGDLSLSVFDSSNNEIAATNVIVVQ